MAKKIKKIEIENFSNEYFIRKEGKTEFNILNNDSGLIIIVEKLNEIIERLT